MELVWLCFIYHKYGFISRWWPNANDFEVGRDRRRKKKNDNDNDDNDEKKQNWVCHAPENWYMTWEKGAAAILSCVPNSSSEIFVFNQSSTKRKEKKTN